MTTKLPPYNETLAKVFAWFEAHTEHDPLDLDRAMLELHGTIELAAWYEAREPYVRALIGAVEDSGVFRDEAQDEWRQVVLWEEDNKKP